MQYLGKRSRALTDLLWLSARHVRLGRVAFTVAVGGVPLAAHVVNDGTTSSLPVAVLVVAAGAAVGWAVDDPAAETLGACPIGSPRRTRLRVLEATVTAVVAVVAVTGTATVIGDVILLETARLPEGVAAGAMALAAGLIAWRRGDPLAGVPAVCTGCVAPFVITGLGIRLPATFPTLAAATPHDRWWVVAATAAAVAMHAGRDPGSRPLGHRVRRRVPVTRDNDVVVIVGRSIAEHARHRPSFRRREAPRHESAEPHR